MFTAAVSGAGWSGGWGAARGNGATAGASAISATGRSAEIGSAGTGSTGGGSAATASELGRFGGRVRCTDVGARQQAVEDASQVLPSVEVLADDQRVDLVPSVDRPEGRAPGQDDDRQRRRPLTRRHLLADRQAVDARHVGVDQQQIGRRFGHRDQRIQCVAGGRDREAEGRAPLRQGVPERGVAGGDQDLRIGRHRSGLVRRRAGAIVSGHGRRSRARPPPRPRQRRGSREYANCRAGGAGWSASARRRRSTAAWSVRC